MALLWVLTLLALIPVNQGFFFGMMNAGNCNCPPQPPPSVCNPQASCQGGYQPQNNYPQSQPQNYQNYQLYQPQPPYSPQYQYQQQQQPQQQSPAFNLMPPPPAPSSYALPQLQPQQQPSPPVEVVHPQSPPAPYLEPIPAISEYGITKGYVNPNLDLQTSGLSYETHEPPTPPPFAPLIPESPSTATSSESNDDHNDLFADYGDAIVPEIVSTPSTAPPPQPPPPPPPPSIAPSYKQPEPEPEHSEENSYERPPQVEVDPSSKQDESPYDSFGEDSGSFGSKIIKKGRKTIDTPTEAPTTTVSVTFKPIPSMSMHPGEMYDDEMPGKPGPMGLNNSNKTLTKKDKDDILADDYSDSSFKLKMAGVKSRLENVLPSTDGGRTDVKCGNYVLKRIMLENIVTSPTISKHLIFSAGKMRFQRPLDVVCSRNKFSYTVISSQVYCEVSKPPVTCFAFFQP